MREIKFRGWHTVKKIMFSAKTMASDQLTLLPTGEFINVNGTSTKLSTIFPKDKFIPLQYTGLHDKNGKEIYEGDILKDDDSIRLECVVWDCASWWEKDIKADTLMYPLCREIAYKTVIGNIYENSELLK